MPYALFLNNNRICGPFSTKAEAWAYAENRGLATLFPSHDEDPPRKVLNLNYSIRVDQNDTRPIPSTLTDHPTPESGTTTPVAER
jgi:hypothetical protein